MPQKSDRWIHHPDGWPRERHIALTRQQRAAHKRRTGRDQSHRVQRLRGKQKCQHSDYITNRAGKILTDPDTGYLARTSCKQVARWERQIIKRLNLRELGIAGFRVIERYCDRHAAAAKAKGA